MLLFHRYFFPYFEKSTKKRSILFKVLSSISLSCYCLPFKFMCAFTKILVMMFWNFIMFQYKSDLPQVKQKLVSSTKNLVYKFPHELPNNLRLRMLGNQEIIKKSQIWLVSYSSAQPVSQKLKFSNSSKEKKYKSRYQTFLVLPKFTELLYFVPSIFSGIKDTNNERYRFLTQQLVVTLLILLMVVK